MADPSTLAFGLTYTGTLAVALLMFLVQLVAFAILLAVAGLARLVAYPFRAVRRPFTKSNQADEWPR
ncbi:hypothetical protein ACVWY0_001246 [Arthrobacter sp. UYNi723]